MDSVASASQPEKNGPSPTSTASSALPDPSGVRPSWGYATALGAATFAGLVQYVLLPEPSVAPFVFFDFSVAPSVAWIAGRGPGLVTVLLCAIIANRLSSLRTPTSTSPGRP